MPTLIASQNEMPPPAIYAREPSSIVHGPSSPSISVVIASLNERDNLIATVASVKADCPEAEIIVVDDGSTQPEPISAIRNPARIGGPRSRRLGALAAKGDVVIFLDAHNALDWETACWFAKRYPEIGPIKPEFKEMLDRPNKLRTLAEASVSGKNGSGQWPVASAQSAAGVAVTGHWPLSTDHCSIVYGGCLFATGRSGFTLVHEKGLYGGRWVQRRPDLPPLVLWRTPAMMGAFYAIPRSILDDFGGWPALPNFHGAQELAVALLAIAHRVPIYFHSGVALWHLFRGDKKGQVRTPFDLGGWNASYLGYPAAWRLVLDDAHWKDFRARLAAGQGPHGEIPEHVLAQCETDEFNRCRADAQSRFKLTSDELLAELDRQIAQNREERIQGAEDKALNTNKKVLLAIGFYAGKNLFFGKATIEESRLILGRALESARAAGADEIALCVTGNADAVRAWPEIAGIRVIPVPNANVMSSINPGLPLGETRLVRAAIEHAQKEGFEWIVKIGADVFHPRPNWAKDMVQRAICAPNGAALITGICADSKCTVTKVFAARTDFLARTWPLESDVAPLGSGAVLERIWTAKIADLGVTNLWLPIECRHVFEGTTRTNWWTPTDPAFAYHHTHQAAVAANWKMEK